MTESIGKRGVGAAGPAWADAVDEIGVAETASLASVDDLERDPPPPTPPELDEILIAPGAAHRARPVELGAITAALARVASRPAVPGEPAAIARMREVAAAYLALRLDVAAGVARISVG